MENHELTLIRTIKASREKVFKAWTDSKMLAQWWGPRGVTNPICEIEAKPQGKIHVVMVAGKELGDLSGQRWPMKGMVKEITAPSKLVFTAQALNAAEDKMILENLVTVKLDEINGQTNMMVQVEVTKTTPEAEGPLKGMEMGWNQSLDKLSELMADIIG